MTIRLVRAHIGRAALGLALIAAAGRAQTPEPIVSPHAVDQRVCLPPGGPGAPLAGAAIPAAAVDSALDRFIETDTIADLERALQSLPSLYPYVRGAPRRQPDSARAATTFRALHLADSVQAALRAVGRPANHVGGPAGRLDPSYPARVAENQRRYDASMCSADVRQLEQRAEGFFTGWLGDAYRNNLPAQSQLLAEARAAGLASATLAQITRLSFGALTLSAEDPRPPTFDLVIPATTAAGLFFPGAFTFGDTVRVPVEGRLLAGGPLRSGTVSWSASYQTNASAPGFGGFRVGWAQDTLKVPATAGSIVLDASGRAVLAIPTPADVMGRNFLAVAATLSAPGGPDVTAKRLVTIASDSFFVGIRPGKPPQADNRWHPGDTYTFDVAAFRLDGKHVVGTTLRVLAVQTSVYAPRCGLGTSPQRDTLLYKGTSTHRDTLLYKEIVTARDPASFIVTVPSSGNLEVCVAGDDPHGREVVVTDWFGIRP